MSKAKASPKAAVPAAKKKGGKKKSGLQGQLFLMGGIVMAAVLLASTVMLVIGMMPTIVAALVDRSARKTKAVTVGAMNLAGCAPFLFELWREGHSLTKAIAIISQPAAIVIIYAASCVGYLIDWAVAGIVAGILYQRGVTRQKAIQQRQVELVQRWGKEVTGDIPLDDQGFPIQQTVNMATAKAS